MDFAKRVFRKLVRLIEGPPVRERTIVRVVDAGEQRDLRPGFLVGVYRSGTTLLRYILDSHANIAVPPETNFIEPLAELWTSDWHRKGFRGVGVDDEALKFRLRKFAGSILDDYAAAKGKQRWFDKTPCYIDILDEIDQIFGERTQYIFVYRHGLDVAASLASVHATGDLGGPAKRNIEQYGDTPRLAALRHWVDQCRKMLAFQERYPERCFEIRYEQYAVDPARYLPALFEFIGESWDENVLDFKASPHDFGLQDHKILESRGFNASTGNYKSWPAADLTMAEEIGGKMLARLDYSI